jgi:hypothetical protein
VVVGWRLVVREVDGFVVVEWSGGVVVVRKALRWWKGALVEEWCCLWASRM